MSSASRSLATTPDATTHTSSSDKSSDGHLRPPGGKVKKGPGPAESGQLIPRSISATRCNSASANSLSPVNSKQPSEAACSLRGRCEEKAASASSQVGHFERSRSSGRLAVAPSLLAPGELKRGSAASASVLPTSSLALAPPPPTTFANNSSTTVATGTLPSGGSSNNVNKSILLNSDGSSRKFSSSSANANRSGQAKFGQGSSTTNNNFNAAPNANTVTFTSAEHRKSKKFLNQWRQKASMSKLGKGTRSLLGKWKTHSQSVDVVTGHGGQKSNAPSDCLDIGLGHVGSDPGSTDGHAFAVDKTTAAAAATAQNGRKISGKNAGKTSTSSTPGQQHSKDIPEETAPKPKASWSEHVWTAWVHRGFSDDVTEVSTLQPGGDLLTDFQKDKFRYFFIHVLDLNGDNVISAEDFDKLNDRMRHYMDWSLNSIHYLALKELHETFLECFLSTASNFAKKDDGDNTRNPEQMFENWKLGFPIGSVPRCNNEHRFDYWDPFKRLDSLYDKMEHVTLSDVLYDTSKPEMKTCISMEEWIDVWGIVVGKAKRMDDFPMWLQYYPKVLFDIINRSGTGVITKSELKYFYTAFMDVGKLGESKLDEITNNAYTALTSSGDVKLTFHIYRLSFLNFLLGKQPNGPGQYLFGTVVPHTSTCMFPIDYSAMNSTEEDLEPFRPDKLEKGSRRSVLV